MKNWDPLIILIGLALGAFSALAYFAEIITHMGESMPSVP